MSLDVGVVKIEYMNTPAQIVQDFLHDMLLDPYAGVFDDDGDDDRSLYEEWGGRWDNNALCELWRTALATRAGNWANEKALGVSERTVLMDWVAALPWQDDGRIMLHLGV